MENDLYLDCRTFALEHLWNDNTLEEIFDLANEICEAIEKFRKKAEGRSFTPREQNS